MQHKTAPFRHRDYTFKSEAMKLLYETDEYFKSDFSDSSIDNIIEMYDIPEFKELNYSVEHVRDIFRNGICESICMLVKINDSSDEIIKLISLNPLKYIVSLSSINSTDGLLSRVWKNIDSDLTYSDSELIIIDLTFRLDYLVTKYEKLVENGKRNKMDSECLNILKRDVKINELINDTI